MPANENQIVVYQPNDMVRLDVRLENETVWLTQAQLCSLFQRDVSVISRHIKNIFAEGELDRESNLHFLQIANADRPVAFYSLEVIISVGYRVKSIIGTRFRQWANKVLKEYLLRGYSVNTKLNQLEDKIDRRLLAHDKDIAELKDKVDFFVQTKEPPLQEVFFQGRFWDAKSLLVKFIRRAPHLRRGEDGRRNHPRAARIRPQGYDGATRIREYENGCEGTLRRADFHAETQRRREGVAA